MESLWIAAFILCGFGIGGWCVAAARELDHAKVRKQRDELLSHINKL
jgi:hypothetical protein